MNWYSEAQWLLLVKKKNNDNETNKNNKKRQKTRKRHDSLFPRNRSHFALEHRGRLFSNSNSVGGIVLLFGSVHVSRAFFRCAQWRHMTSYQPWGALRLVRFEREFPEDRGRHGFLLLPDKVGKVGPRLVHSGTVREGLELYGSLGRQSVHHLEIRTRDLYIKKVGRFSSVEELQFHWSNKTETSILYSCVYLYVICITHDAPSALATCRLHPQKDSIPTILGTPSNRSLIHSHRQASRKHEGCSILACELGHSSGKSCDPSRAHRNVRYVQYVRTVRPQYRRHGKRTHPLTTL